MSPLSSTWDVRQFFCGFVLHRNINKGQGGPAERFVFPEDQREIATDLRIGDGNCRQNLGANIFLDIGARDEADAHICGHEPL